MTTPFIGEIRMFAGNFAPTSHALCDGQLINITQNQALFALIGTIYGGDGRTTFALPDLRGRVPIHGGSGVGPGLSPRQLGSGGGIERVTLTASQIPSHNHPANASLGGNAVSPVGKLVSTDPAGNSAGYNTSSDGSVMNNAVIQSAGGGQPHPNMQPFLGIHFIIALFGIFPSQS